LEATIKHRAPKRIFDVFHILLSSNNIEINDLGKEVATKYLCEAYDDCMVEYAIKEQSRLRNILRATAYRKFGKALPSQWTIPIPVDRPPLPKSVPQPPPPPPVDGWGRTAPPTNAWNQPNLIQQLHGHGRDQNHSLSHQQILDNCNPARVNDIHTHRNHRDDFNMHHNNYPQFHSRHYNPPHNHPMDDNHMGNPYPRHPQPQGWGNGAKNWKENSNGPAGQGRK